MCLKWSAVLLCSRFFCWRYKTWTLSRLCVVLQQSWIRLKPQTCHSDLVLLFLLNKLHWLPFAHCSVIPHTYFRSVSSNWSSCRFRKCGVFGRHQGSRVFEEGIFGLGAVGGGMYINLTVCVLHMRCVWPRCCTVDALLRESASVSVQYSKWSFQEFISNRIMR